MMLNAIKTLFQIPVKGNHIKPMGEVADRELSDQELATIAGAGQRIGTMTGGDCN